MSIFNINNESISNKPNNLPPNINFVQKRKNPKLYTKFEPNWKQKP